MLFVSLPVRTSSFSHILLSFQILDHVCISSKWFTSTGPSASIFSASVKSLYDQGRQDHTILWSCNTVISGRRQNRNMVEAAEIAAKMRGSSGIDVSADYMRLPHNSGFVGRFVTRLLKNKKQNIFFNILYFLKFLLNNYSN